jgi:hypothetical protein
MEASAVKLSPITEAGEIDADDASRLAALLLVLTPFAVAAWIGLGFLIHAGV